jgi:DNA helicase-2/ATP-dependent DNA helicase PcrA
MKQLLTPMLQQYKLSATHLCTFLDVSRGGPQQFLLGNLLRFPQSMSPDASYGTAIHRTLQQAHAHLKSTGKRRPLEDFLSSFETNLSDANLTPRDFERYHKRGIDALQAFFDKKYDMFAGYTNAELGFAGQQSQLDEARLTGSLDAVRIDTETKQITVTDYKTGKGSSTWNGKTDYEKIKLHHYKQQLLFYKLLIEHSRDYENYEVTRGYIEFVEPTAKGNLLSLETDFDPQELARLRRLIHAVWQRIQNLDFPDVSAYSADYKGIVAFENNLLDEAS